MTLQADRRISHRRAAELLFRTSKPSPGQMERVTAFIAQGELAGDSRGTTAEAVAEFASRAALDRQQTNGRDRDGQRPQRGNQLAQEVYQESLKQYFLAIFLRRKMHNVSKQFRRAVLIGQVGVLCVVAFLVLMAFRSVFPPLAPERAATVTWLEENTDRFRVIRYHPTTHDESGNAQLWVEYHYITPQGRGIDTRRMFTVAGDKVVAVDSDE